MFSDSSKNENLVIISKFKCDDCNYSFYTTNSKPLDKCVVCNSTNIKSVDGQENITSYILPFKKTLDEAKAKYIKKVRLNPLIPISFKKKSTINCISKIYIPALLVNANMKGDIDFLGGDKSEIVSNGEKAIETRKYEVSASVNFDYNKLALCTSTLVSDKVFNNIGEYNFDDLKPFSSSFCEDSYCINVNTDIANIGNRNRDYITKKSLKLVRDNVPHQLKKTVDNKTSITFNNSIQVLLPIYYLRLRYGKKDYIYIMNGDNGEITFDLVFGKLEVVIFGLIVFVIIFGIGFLISYFL